VHSFAGNDIHLLSKFNFQLIQKFIKKHDFIMCQKFLPKISKGDKRVFIINGKIAGAISRVPKKGSFLSNMSKGGKATNTNLTIIEKKISKKIANDLNVEVKDVLHMENRLSSTDAAFDSPSSTNDDEEMMSPAQYLEDKRYDPELLVSNAEVEKVNNTNLMEALKLLDDRSKDILLRRYLADEKATLHDLADEYGVSAERIRQIETGALKKLKASMVSAA